ncbi:MAG: PQQ-binding-like beta-propeller repeat protein [Bdellovibrionales bacterium]|nr:PQQ-binding-like beta-propeller repeat protein [Bdellovibrionales bacterium]
MRRISVLPVITFLLVGACSGPQVYRDFQAEKPVLTRQWSMSTRARETLAGERGVEFSNPLLWENTLLFGTSEAGLVALYPGMGGQIRWVLPVSGGVISELTREGSDVYFGGADGFVYCVSAETGRVLWRYEVRNPKISKPTIQGGKLFVTTSDDMVYALEAATGKWLWHYKRKPSGSASIHAASQPWTDGTQVLAGTSDGYLVSLSANDGRLISEKKLSAKAKFTDVDAGVVLDGPLFFVPSYDGSLYALKKSNLEIQWKYDAGGARAVSIDGDRLILASSDGSVYAFQKSSGKLLWKFQLDGGSPTAAIITDRYIIVGSSYQYLYALDKASGELKDRWNVGYGSGFSGGMAYDANQKMLYAVSGAANLYSFKIQ